ncbi:MAG: hypothetical protein ACLR13_05535 [Acutalibacteraceae bacterium]
MAEPFQILLLNLIQNTSTKSCDAASLHLSYFNDDSLDYCSVRLKDASAGYTLAIAIILWFTVLFANFAEAIAEGKARHRPTLRAAKDVEAHKYRQQTKRMQSQWYLPQL